MPTPSSPPASPSAAAPDDPLFRRGARWVLRHRWLVLAANCALTAWLGFALSGLRTDMGYDPYLPAHSEARTLNDAFKDDFGHDVYSMVLIEGDVFSRDYLRRLQALHRDIAAIDVDIPSLGRRDYRPDAEARGAAAHAGGGGAEATAGDGWGDTDWGDEAGGSIFEEVTSLANARQTLSTPDGIRVQGRLSNFPSAEAIPAFRRSVLADKTLVGRIVGPGGRHSLVIARTDHMDDVHNGIVADALRVVASRHDGAGFRVTVGGTPALLSTLEATLSRDVETLFLASLLVMIAATAWVFRSPLGVLGPALSVSLSAVWTLGIAALLHRPVTQVTGIIPAFLICVGVGDAVHIQSAYREGLRRGVERGEAIVGAVASSGLPVVLTSVTTALGLLSFLTTDASAMVDMGLLGAIGVIAAMFQCLTLLPVFLSWHRKGSFGARPAPSGGGIDRFLSWCNAASNTPARARRLLALTVGLSLLCVALASRIYVSHDDLRTLDADVPSRQVFERVNAHIGGGGDLALYIRTRGDSTLADRALMVGLERLEQHIRSYRDPDTGRSVVTNVGGVLDIVREANRALHGGDEAAYGVPATQRAVADVFTLFESTAREELQRVATVDLRRGAMFVRTLWMDSRRFQPLIDHIERGIAQHIGDRADLRVSGTGALWTEVTNHTLSNLIRSFSLAFLAITLMMGFLMRSLRLGLIAMGPNLLPIVGVLAFMGACDIWLDFSNSLVASLTLGIVVDDTIHFLHHFRAHLTRSRDVEAALAHAYAHSGRAMTITSMVLGAGFLTFLFASLATNRWFGLLVAATVGMALCVDLILTPALLRVAYGRAGGAAVARPWLPQTSAPR